MTPDHPPETIVDREITYTLELDGKLIVIEHVPARIVEETGEVLLSPATVERLQRIVQLGQPSRVVQTPVFEFAA